MIELTQRQKTLLRELAAREILQEFSRRRAAWIHLPALGRFKDLPDCLSGKELAKRLDTWLGQLVTSDSPYYCSDED